MKNRINQYIRSEIRMHQKIISFQWHITNRCQERCTHCYLDKQQAIDVKGYTYVMDAIDEFARTGMQQPKKVLLSFIGGDPLLHPQIFDMIRYAAGKNMEVIIKGNPSRVTSESARKLKACGIHRYNLSLDGLKETHDQIRSPGSFDLTMKAIKILKEASIKTSVKFTVSKMNAAEITPAITAAEEAGVDFFDFGRYCPGTKKELEYILSSAEYRKLLMGVLKHYQQLLVDGAKLVMFFRDHLWMPLFYELGLLDDDILRGKEQITAGCSMGVGSSAVIDVNGNLLPCAKLSTYVLGNVYRQKIRDIYDSSLSKKRRDIREYKDCQHCALGRICRGCPAISHAVYGSPFEADPQCWLWGNKE